MYSNTVLGIGIYYLAKAIWFIGVKEWTEIIAGSFRLVFWPGNSTSVPVFVPLDNKERKEETL